MKIFLTIVAFLFALQNITGQETPPNLHTRQIQKINSITERTDKSKKLSKKSPNGNDPKIGPFSFTYYYIPNNEVQKIECQFANDTSGMKTFYYLKNELIKIIDQDNSYYFIDGSLYNNQGIAVESSSLTDLAKFQEGLKKDIITFMLR